MLKLILALTLLISFVSVSLADINWVDGYFTKAGRYRSGHFKDTSADGNPYNNANYLGLN